MPLGGLISNVYILSWDAEEENGATGDQRMALVEEDEER